MTKPKSSKSDKKASATQGSARIAGGMLRWAKPIGLGCAAAAVLAVAGYAVATTQLPVTPTYREADHAIDQGFRLGFGRALASLGTVTIEPEVKGQWHEYRTPLGVTGIEFRPEGLFRAAQTYTVRVDGAQRLLTGAVELEEFRFTTEKAPELSQFSVAEGEDVMVASDYEFEAVFAGSAEHLRDVVLTTEPALELTRQTDDHRTYRWRAKDLLPQGGTLALTLRDAQNDETLATRTVQVAPAPTITAGADVGGVMPGGTVTIEFSEAIDQARLPESAMTFDVPGTGEWASETTYRYRPEGLQPGKTYGYTVAKALRTARGGVTTEAMGGRFSTNGAVTLASRSPTGRELAQGRQDIVLTFNQPVDKKSAEARVTVSAGTVESMTWRSSTTLVVRAVNFGFQRTVAVNVAPGVQPVFGLSNTATLGFSFTTEVQTHRLSVPYYRQAFAQSCEAASLRMALAYRGTHSTDWDILQRFGYAPRHKDKENNAWDDPQQQFVGDVRGDQGKGTGWGVYAEPVARATRSFGRSATTQYGVSAQFLASQLYADRPVILWGIWGNSAAIQSWQTPEGRTAAGPFPMHVRLVVGVKGEPGNPLGFWVHDPITGPAYWSTGQLMSNTQKAGPANQAVVIQ